MKILFATDHVGFELKNILVEYVKTLGFEVEYNNGGVRHR